MTPIPTLPIVALYAGLNGLILIWLAAVVSRIRARTGIWIGDGGVDDLIRAMRGQANFAEYVPLCLLLLLLMAGLGAPGYVLHLFGIALTAGRLLHGLHFSGAVTAVVARQVGAYLTAGVLLFASLGLIAHALGRLG